MKTPAPAVNLAAQAPEWAVIGIPHEGADEHLDKIAVYQNGSLVITATADDPTYDALALLVRRANAHNALANSLSELVGALWDSGNHSLPCIEKQYAKAVKTAKALYP